VFRVQNERDNNKIQNYNNKTIGTQIMATLKRGALTPVYTVVYSGLHNIGREEAMTFKIIAVR
jgi:hypothetical protein